MKLVLLPGLDGTGQLFEPLLDCLPAGIDAEVIAYPSDEPLGYDEITRYVESRLPVDQSFIVLGESFSSPVALRLASRESAGLCGVILSCGFARNPRPELAPFVSLLPVVPVRGAVSAAARNFLLGIEDRTLRERAEIAIAGVDPDVIRQRLMAVASVDVREALTTVEVPVLYLKASHDRLVPGSSIEEIQRLAPHVDVVTLDGPHMLLQVQPAAAARAIQAFLDSC